MLFKFEEYDLYASEIADGRNYISITNLHDNAFISDEQHYIANIPVVTISKVRLWKTYKTMTSVTVKNIEAGPAKLKFHYSICTFLFTDPVFFHLIWDKNATRFF